LSKQIIEEDRLPSSLRYVAGVDVAYGEGWAYGAASVMDYASLVPVEAKTARVKTSLPYIPTLLSFREIKPALAAIRKLNVPPDLFLVDAHGMAHPFRLGFASHLGLLLDKPTIGVAKSRLHGYVEPENREGWSPITDKGEIIGAALRRNDTERPVYVSVGHKVSLVRAITIVRHCTKYARIPEPIRMAHFLAAAVKRKHKRKIT
jgi:deoxyribonuclease V